MTVVAVLLLAACQKDENGNRITYYKNKTGEGYVFFVYYSDTLLLRVPDRIEKNLIDSMRPAPNVKIEIHAFTNGFMDTGILRHFDYVYTDNSGKYSFKLVKYINAKSVSQHHITGEKCTPSLTLYHAIETKKGYIMDTLYIVRNTNYSDRW